LIILGIALACVTIPGIVDFMNTMKNKMEMDVNVTNDIASGII
jgi:hypothetical protein